MENKNHFQKPETIAIHGATPDKTVSGEPLITPEIRSTIFRHHPDHQTGNYSYTRSGNPNRKELETVLAKLEGGVDCAAFSSGMAATAAIFQALEPGDHVIIPGDVYHGTRTFVNQMMKRWGVLVTEADMNEPESVRKEIQKHTSLIWVETPSNPMLFISDISALAKIARENGSLFVVDNTWPSPMNQNPLKWGADLVMHSSTKYLGGHSDILGGAVITGEKSEFFDRIRTIQETAGAVPSPSDCWLLVRSIKTLPYRIRAHNENAQKIAEYLEQKDVVKKVYYPGLPSHSGYEIAKQQMNGFGGMISFEVEGGAVEALGIVNRAQLITPATSLGGVESLWEHRRSVESEESETPESLIRFSVGIEHIDDLLEDVEQALEGF